MWLGDLARPLKGREAERAAEFDKLPTGVVPPRWSDQVRKTADELKYARRHADVAIELQASDLAGLDKRAGCRGDVSRGSKPGCFPCLAEAAGCREHLVLSGEPRGLTRLAERAGHGGNHMRGRQSSRAAGL